MDRRVFTGKGWLGVVLSLILCLALVFSVAAPMAAEDAEEGCASCQPYPIMRPDMETLWEWIEAYNDAPRAEIELEGFEAAAFGASKDLLSHLDYDAATRNQGNCGNCWAWAGTGCLGIALDVQEGTKDRLSVQYVNSCKSTGNYACCGGTLVHFADFYDPGSGGTGKCIPWSNTNASWQDGSKNCVSGSSDVSCASITKAPNYSITAIQETTIVTQTVNQATAIANIKNVLNQDRAVWFGFFLPDNTAWTDFSNFWDNNGETVVYAMDQFCGQSYNPAPGEGGGHAVLCVGYNDEPGDRYWVMLNSWGTGPTTNRPNGLFRIDMDMDYDGQNPGLGGGDYSFYWQTLDVSFWSVPDITVDPTSFAVTLPPDTSWDDTLTIGNDGNGDLTYDISDYKTTGGMTAPRGVEVPALRQGEVEGPIELIELNPSEPMSFAVPPLPFAGVQEEIAYDDGMAESYSCCTGAPALLAVRFTPSSYPVSLDTARICLAPDWPDSDHEEFAVEVYDDDGAGGEPGTCLGTVTTEAANWGWWDVDISGLGVTIAGGDFYIAYKQLSGSPDCEGMCLDESAPDGRSWFGFDGNWLPEEDWAPRPGDWMIRCVVEKPDCSWLSEDPTSGSVPPGKAVPIIVSIDTTGLAEGDYTANIVIANNDPDGDPSIVPVTLHVSPGGLMEGDATVGGCVSIADGLLIVQYKVGLKTLTADQLKCADTTDEGAVSIADALHIVQWLVDPEGTFGVLAKPLWESPADNDMLPPQKC